MLNFNFATLIKAWRHHAGQPARQVLADLGWSERAGLPGYTVNGAILTSLSLIAAGAPLAGPLRIEAGPWTGRKVENGANRLADWLATRHQAPETLSLVGGLGQLANQLHGRRGILAFIQGNGPAGGHIAIVDGRSAMPACIAADARQPMAVHFWEIA